MLLLSTANNVDGDTNSDHVIKPSLPSSDSGKNKFETSSSAVDSNSGTIPTSSKTKKLKTTPTSPTVTGIFKAIGYLTWFWGLVYALFIVVYYGTTWWWWSVTDRNSTSNEEEGSEHPSLEEAWNHVDDPTMFEANKPMQSQIFLWMIFGPGVYLLVVGPLQFVPSLRKRSNSETKSSIHASLGRTILPANLSTAVGGILYLLFIKGHRTLHPTLEDHGDFATFVFGILVLTCTVQTYRYAPSHSSSQMDKTNNNDLRRHHRQWACRLTALQAGNVLFRLYVTSFKIYLRNQNARMQSSTTNIETPNDEHFVTFYSSMLTWSFFVPNLVFVEFYLWYTAMNRNNRKGKAGRGPSRKSKMKNDMIVSPQPMCSSSVETFTSFVTGLVVLFLLIMGILTATYLWIPGIIWCLGTKRNELPSFCS